uniref:HTH CENPB-type domain-containing protein n=1 Tax=Amphimedon queenslandica TaxID=400682 RepID=A0A1X7UAJ7_AMPQE
MAGGRRKPMNLEMEENFLGWISELRANNLRVMRSQIQTKALELRDDADFQAGRGLLERFFERHSLSLHPRTTVSQRLPTDLEPQVTFFIMHTRQLRNQKKYPLHLIGNMDETPLWMDLPG